MMAGRLAERARAPLAALLACCLALAVPTTAVFPQRPAREIVATGGSRARVKIEGTQARAAAAMVAEIRTYKENGDLLETGAGVIGAVSAGRLRIVTARHVVALSFGTGRNRYSVPNPHVKVFLLRADGLRDSVPGTAYLLDSTFLAGVRAERERVTIPDSVGVVVATVERDSTLISNYDLAVVEVDLKEAQARGWTPPPLDRLGNVARLKVGDQLTPIGCPFGECWRVLLRLNQFHSWLRGGVRFAGEVSFQSASVAPGNSGGALFDDYFDLVGIVISTDNQLAKAVPVDEIQAVLRRAGFPVQWTAPRFSRPGRTLGVQVDWLTALDAPSLSGPSGSARLPSGRVQLAQRGRGAVGWHAAALRLAPTRFSIHALTVGGDYILRSPRLSVTVGADVGFGTATSQRDLGGFLVTSGSGSARYEPVWAVEHAASPIVGATATVAWLVHPRLALAASVSRWSFGTTPNASPVPYLYSGGGIRWHP